MQTNIDILIVEKKEKESMTTFWTKNKVKKLKFIYLIYFEKSMAIIWRQIHIELLIETKYVLNIVPVNKLLNKLYQCRVH